MNDQIKKAIGAHGMWKNRLQEAVSTGKSDFTVDGVAKDNNCEFGKWLYSTNLAGGPHAKRYETVRKMHAEFHVEVSKVLGLALTGKRDAAVKALGDGTPFANLSAQLTREMMAWANEAA